MFDPGIRPLTFRAQHRPALALVGVFAAFFAFNAISLLLPKKDYDRVWMSIGGVFVFEPMIFGMWVALATGSLLTRLPIAVAFLTILFLAPEFNLETYADIQRGEFIAMIVAAFAIFLTTMLLFLGARWLFRIQIDSDANQKRDGAARIHFSIKYLLALITLYAVVFGMLSQLSLKPNRYPSFLGPNFLMQMIMVSSGILSATVLPILAAPLLILYRGSPNRVFPVAVAFWAVFTALIVVIWALIEKESWPELIEVVLWLQAGAFIAGVLTALPLRLVGMELGRSRLPGAELPDGPPRIPNLSG